MTPKLYTRNQTTKKLNSILSSIAELSKYRARPFVYHLYDKGYSSKQIAEIIGTSRQLVEHDYPKGGK